MRDNASSAEGGLRQTEPPGDRANQVDTGAFRGVAAHTRLNAARTITGIEPEFPSETLSLRHGCAARLQGTSAAQHRCSRQTRLRPANPWAESSRIRSRSSFTATLASFRVGGDHPLDSRSISSFGWGERRSLASAKPPSRSRRPISAGSAPIWNSLTCPRLWSSASRPSRSIASTVG